MLADICIANRFTFYFVFILFSFLNYLCPPSRCKAGTSWSAKNSDFDQRLIIDLGLVKNVTHIALQGRPHSNEYVTEYTISYGITDLEFADYKEPGGNIKVSNTKRPTRLKSLSNPIIDHVCVACVGDGGGGFGNGPGYELTKNSCKNLQIFINI